MYIKLDEKELEIIKRAMNITITDYELEGNMFPGDSLVPIVEDLLNEIDSKEEKVSDLEKKYWQLVSGEHYEDLS